MNRDIEATITDKIQMDDQWRYAWKQVRINSTTGEAEDPLTAKEGSTTLNYALERNNVEVETDTRVTLRQWGYADGQLVWVFDVGTGANIGSGTQYHIPAWSGGSNPALIDTLMFTDANLGVLTVPQSVDSPTMFMTSAGGWQIIPPGYYAVPQTFRKFFCQVGSPDPLAGPENDPHPYVIGTYRGIKLTFDTDYGRLLLAGSVETPGHVMYAIEDEFGFKHDGWWGTLADGTVVKGGIIVEGGEGSVEDDPPSPPSPPPPGVFPIPPDGLGPVSPGTKRCYDIVVADEDGSVGWLNIQMDEIAGGALADTKAVMTAPDGSNSVLWDHPSGVGIGPFDFRLSPTLIPGTGTPSPWPNIQEHNPSNPVEDDMCGATWVVGADVNNGVWRLCITADAGVTVTPTGLSLHFGEIPSGGCCTDTLAEHPQLRITLTSPFSAFFDLTYVGAMTVPTVGSQDGWYLNTGGEELYIWCLPEDGTWHFYYSDLTPSGGTTGTDVSCDPFSFALSGGGYVATVAIRP